MTSVGDVDLRLGGYVQVDAVPWAQDSIDELEPSTRAPLNEQRLLVRRARVKVEARRGPLAAAVEVDGNTVDGARAGLVGATVGYARARAGAGDTDEPLVAIAAGLLKAPFGAEVPASERDKPMLEPPAFARALFPGNYDAGVAAHGAFGFARWALGVVDGAPVGDARWHGRDPLARVDVVARLGAVIDGPARSRFEAGVSALTGRGLHPGDPPTKDGLQWIDENEDGIVQTTELQVVPGTPGTPSEAYAHAALGADLRVSWCLCRLGPGTAFAEVAVATNLDRGLVYADPVEASRELRQLGFAVGAVQDVGAHAQVGVRYDRYDADRDASEREGVELVGAAPVFATWAVMAAARWGDARWLVQYDHERNPFGRGDDGRPATLEADRVTVRAQVGF
ncbi:MAG TPA: hypothetical protein VHE35_26725 [Kofleriaceae bacterium]|nr:hypothetical protein [Kofleriaceae bacterium]